MPTPIARIGDSISHGGQIVTGAGKWVCEGEPIARVTDQAICAIHGPVVITTGSPNWVCEGHPIARIGSLLSCTAVVVTGASK